MMGVLNNKDVQGQICPGLAYSSKAPGRFKKSVQQGRSRFFARSVRVVREHGKIARTPLAAFFNRPMIFAKATGAASSEGIQFITA
jgi:hypothetical protein